MNSKRVYFVLLGLIGLLLLGLLGGAYGVNQMLHQRSDTMVDLKLQSQVLDDQQVGLAKAKTEIKKYTELNNIATSIVPQDKDQAEAVREISNLAAASGIPRLSSVTFPASTLGAVGAASSGTAQPAAGGTKSNLTQLTPVKGVGGLYQLQITIQQTSDNPVPYTEFLTFLSKLEQNRRTAQVTSISIAPDSRHASSVAFTLVINEFIRP